MGYVLRVEPMGFADALDGVVVRRIIKDDRHLFWATGWIIIYWGKEAVLGEKLRVQISKWEIVLLAVAYMSVKFKRDIKATGVNLENSTR